MIPELSRIIELPCAEGTFFAAATAVIVGDVTLGPDCNIWHHCVIRGDVAPMRLGRRINVQDGSVLHCDYDKPMDIADEVAIGHCAAVHCARIGTRSLIGIKAVVLSDCVIGEDCLIAAGAVVPPGTTVPDGSVVMGVPGKVVRRITDTERADIRYIVDHYVRTAREHAAGRFPPIAEPPRPPGELC